MKKMCRKSLKFKQNKNKSTSEQTAQQVCWHISLMSNAQEAEVGWAGQNFEASLSYMRDSVSEQSVSKTTNETNQRIQFKRKQRFDQTPRKYRMDNKHTKNCLTSPITMETQLRTTDTKCQIPLEWVAQSLESISC